MRYGRHSPDGVPPYLRPSKWWTLAMVEILFMVQLARKPMRAIARRWWCKSLYRASRGQRRCPECTKA
jgi:hypothetical protein